jgi:hypothetical protein
MPLFAFPSVMTTMRLPDPYPDTTPEAIAKAGPKAVWPEGVTLLS